MIKARSYGIATAARFAVFHQALQRRCNDTRLRIFNRIRAVNRLHGQGPGAVCRLRIVHVQPTACRIVVFTSYVNLLTVFSLHCEVDVRVFSNLHRIVKNEGGEVGLICAPSLASVCGVTKPVVFYNRFKACRSLFSRFCAQSVLVVAPCGVTYLRCFFGDFRVHFHSFSISEDFGGVYEYVVIRRACRLQQYSLRLHVSIPRYREYKGSYGVNVRQTIRNSRNRCIRVNDFACFVGYKQRPYVVFNLYKLEREPFVSYNLAICKFKLRVALRFYLHHKGNYVKLRNVYLAITAAIEGVATNLPHGSTILVPLKLVKRLITFRNAFLQNFRRLTVYESTFCSVFSRGTITISKNNACNRHCRQASSVVSLYANRTSGFKVSAKGNCKYNRRFFGEYELFNGDIRHFTVYNFIRFNTARKGYVVGTCGSGEVAVFKPNVVRQIAEVDCNAFVYLRNDRKLFPLRGKDQITPYFHFGSIFVAVLVYPTKELITVLRRRFQRNDRTLSINFRFSAVYRKGIGDNFI